MTISDETLMAYVDGELHPAACAAVDTAMREDPQIEKRVARHRALRQLVQGAYSAQLAEEVPQRLVAAARGAAGKQGSTVVNLKDARASLERKAPLARPLRPGWRTAGTIAASVIIGAGLGLFMWGRTESPFLRTADGALVARGQLANTLSQQLAAEQSRGSSVQIGLSFLAKSGDYCRAFTLAGAVSSSGLACRHGEEWRLEVLSQSTDGAAGETEYRTAGSAMPGIILQYVQRQIAGEPLDQAGEKAARQQGWKAGER